MEVVVSGAGGYIGSSVVAALLRERQINITTLDLNPPKRMADRLSEPVKNLRHTGGDVTDIHSVRRALSRGADVFVHLAAVPDATKCDSDPQRALKTNLWGTGLVLREASRHNCLFIFASSQTVYGGTGRSPSRENSPINPEDLYSLTKAAGEYMVRSYHNAGSVRGVILRISSVYGKGVQANMERIPGKMIVDVVNKGVISLVSSKNIRRPGGQIVDLVHVRDVSEAIKMVIRKEARVAGEVFNVSSGKGLAVSEIAQMVARVAHRRYRNKRIHFAHSFRPVNLIPRLVLSNSKARSILGWQPKVSLVRATEELFECVEATRGDIACE